MPVPTPPTPIASVPATPDRTEGQDIFVGKMFTFLDYFAPFKAYMQDVVTYISDAVTLVSSSSTSTDANRVAAELAETNAEAAAAAAQAAAGLTPDPDFGMVISTTANTAVKTSAYTAEVGVLQDVDTSGGAFAITLPSSPTVGQWFGVRDYNQGRFRTGFPWLDYTSDKIIGLSEDHYINVNTAIYTWRGATKGWCL